MKYNPAYFSVLLLLGFLLNKSVVCLPPLVSIPNNEISSEDFTDYDENLNIRFKRQDDLALPDSAYDDYESSGEEEYEEEVSYDENSSGDQDIDSSPEYAGMKICVNSTLCNTLHCGMFKISWPKS